LCTSGQERFGNMTRVYYKEAVGAFIVFDLTRASTFDAVTKWKNDLDLKVQLPDGRPVPCVLLANKVRWGLTDINLTLILQHVSFVIYSDKICGYIVLKSVYVIANIKAVRQR